MSRLLLSTISIFQLLQGCSGDLSRPVMIDGQISTTEWADAHVVTLDSLNSIYSKSDEYYYYVAVKSKLTKPLYVDVFIQQASGLLNIHASSQLGARPLPDSTWTDTEPPTPWGYTVGWTANTLRFDRKKMQLARDSMPEVNPYSSSYIAYDGMEFQFSKKHFDLNNALWRIEIRNMIGPEGFQPVIFPANSTRKQTINWTTLNF
ncbi:MAG: hypothetical protein VYB44_13490 [Bacteroidota bacterium]|nr:hypothetical protein [Bacteroidota bacterium]